MSRPLQRRLVAAGAALGSMVTGRLLPEEVRLHDRRPSRSRVAILSAGTYAERLEDLLVSALREFHLDFRGKTVLLKPNLVEFLPSVEVNTNPLLVGVTAEAFLRLDAHEVLVGEGPGHQRDTHLVLAASGLDSQLRSQKIRFVDLNRDELIQVPSRGAYTGIDRWWLPKTVLASDFVVSMPKIKTHHWAGVTLSMKNMFGAIPGRVGLRTSSIGPEFTEASSISARRCALISSSQMESSQWKAMARFTAPTGRWGSWFRPMIPSLRISLPHAS